MNRNARLLIAVNGGKQAGDHQVMFHLKRKAA